MNETRTQDEAIVQLTAFLIGDEEYVVDIMRVRQIIKPLPITPVRKGPRFVEGVINLRGAVIPIVDMRRRFELPAEDHPQRKILVMTVDQRTVGLVVDGVTEVVRVPRSEIRLAPGLLDRDHAPYFMGVCHHKGRMLVLLSVRNIVATDADIDVAAATQQMRESL